MNRTMLSVKAYTDTVFETDYESLSKRLISIMELQGKSDGLERKPGSDRHFEIQVIDPVRTEIQQAIDKNYSRHQPVSSIATTQALRANASQKISLLQKEKNEKEKKIALCQSDLNNLQKASGRHCPHWMYFMIPFLFSITEAGILFNILEQTSFSGTSIFFLVLLAFLITFFGLRIGADYICRSTTKVQKKVRLSLVLGIVFLASIMLGTWRTGISNELEAANAEIAIASNEEVYAASPWPFIVLSFLSFLIGLLLEIRFWKSTSQREAIRKSEAAGKRLRIAIRDRDGLKQKIEGINESSDTESAEALAHQECAYTNERRLVSLAHQLIAKYESTNLEYRNDESCPEFFGMNRNLGFTLYFQQLFAHLNKTV